MEHSEQMTKTSGAAYYANPHWEFPDSQESSSTRSPVCSSMRSGIPQSTFSIDFTDSEGDDDDGMDEDEFNLWIAQQHEEETRRSPTIAEIEPVIRRKSTIIVPRNPPIIYPSQALQEYTHKGIRLAPNVFVELRDEDFMKVVHIVRDTTNSDVTLRGYVFRRTKEMNGLLNKRINEVCWVLHVDDDDPREPLVQGVETIAVSEVIRRRAIRLTNRPFPDLSFRNDGKDTQETVMNHRVLVCRYKYLCHYRSAKARVAYAWCEKGLHRLRDDECDKRADNFMTDNDLRRVWRGPTALGGSKEGWVNGEKEFLRQEAISHKGKASRQSLNTANGPDFPIGDIMKRTNVGSILCTQDLSHYTGTSSTSTNQWGTLDSNISRSTKPENRGESSHLLKQERPSKQLRSETISPSTPTLSLIDRIQRESTTMFDIPSGSHRTSVGAPFKGSSPHIIEIDAKVKTSSSSGTRKEHYEGRIKSTYIPSPSSNRKRTADQILDSPTRPSKKAHAKCQGIAHPYRGLSGNRPSGDNKPQTKFSDRDRSFVRSKMNDDVVELSAPSNISHYKMEGLRPVTPFLPAHHDAEHQSACTERQHLLSKGKRYHPTVDDDDVIDLISPHAHTTPRLYPGQKQPFSSHAPRSLTSRANSIPMHLRVSTSSRPASQPTPPYHGSGSSVCRASNSMQPVKRSRRTKANKARSRTASDHSLSSEARATSALQATPVRSQKCHTMTGSINSSKPVRRRYTFGDCFSGAGGMSRGAINAGLRIKWAFDFNLTACETYARNFFATPVYNIAADEFANGGGDRKVDIVHLSPPCQFFSDAHTIQGKDDDMNTASLFAIFNLLEKTKPRVATLEQTSGLIRRHPIFFNSVINMFTSKGFSVRWRVMNCADFGLAQRRMRLFIIASWYVVKIPYHPKLRLPHRHTR